MNEIRVGIVGIGNMGSAHAANIYDGKVEGLRLFAVCDINENKLLWAEERLAGVKQYRDYREMLADRDLDAVIIATPHRFHPVIAVEAFEAGLHVLTEKPAGVDVRSVRAMNAAAKASGKVFGIMYNQRTNPLFARLRQMVADGELGEIKRMVWIVTNWYRTQSYYDSGDWRATWSGEGGGVLLNQCPHNLDIWQWILGVPVNVRAHCKYGRYHRINVEDDVTIYAEYANGATATFITSTGEYPGTNRLEISGTKGKVVIEKKTLKWFRLDKDEREICATEKRNSSKEPVVYTEIVQEQKEAAHLGILQNFANAMLKGETLLAPGEEGILGLSISNAAHLSDWTDRAVALPMSEEDEELFCRILQEKRSAECTEKSAYEDRKTENDGLKGGQGKVQQSGEYQERWDVRW